MSGAGAEVVGVARDRGALEKLRAELGESFTPVTANAVDPMVAGELIDSYRPGVLVLNAGATPLPRPIQHHTWDTFSRNWDVDVAHVFHWAGTPGAKAAIRWLSAYAADESRRAGLGIRFVSLLPR